MPIDALYVDALPGEIRIAGVEEGELRELEIVRAGRESLVGNVYLGKVEKVLAGIRAAFVDIGRERSGFLPLAEGGETLALAEGAAVIVQVRKDAVDDKGALLSARPGLAGRFLVYTPFRAEVTLSRRLKDHPGAPRLVELASGLAGGAGGYVIRTSAIAAQPADLAGEAQTMRDVWQALQQRARASAAPACLHADLPPVHRALRDAAGGALRRIVFDDAETMRAAESFLGQTALSLIPLLSLHRGPEPLFESAGLEEQIERALLAEVPLPSGGSLSIEPTKALVAIDVNSGGAGRAGGAGLNLATNLEAAGRIAREVRLRNLAGQLAIDFLPLKQRRAAAEVLARLKEGFADDPTPAQVFGFTRLGLVEMTRERRRPSLVELLGEPCSACGGAAVVPSPLTVAFAALRKIPATARAEPGKALALRAAPAVVAALRGGEGQAALAEIERRLGRAVMLREEASLSPDRFEIEVLPVTQERAHG